MSLYFFHCIIRSETTISRNASGSCYLTDYDSKRFNIFETLDVTKEKLALLPTNSITRLRNFSYFALTIIPSKSKVIATKRDPRGLIASCTDYHMRGTEEWTTIPRGMYGGKSYCELLRSAKSDEERHIISMNNKAGEVIKNMLTYVDCDNVLMVSLEDLSHDVSGKVYGDICEYMELSSNDTETLSRIFVENALWNIKIAGSGLPRHSTSGVDALAKHRITGCALEHYQSVFGDAHRLLGYSQ